jgi:archaeal flagellin FlaB
MKTYKRKGEMAMGTLIIFIAMILIAAVAAAVLITTTDSLQTKALETGRATRQEVGTNLQIVEIFGEDGSTNNQLESITVMLKLAAGSDPIRFSDLLMEVVVNTTMADLRNTQDPATGYQVTYAINGTSHLDGYLVPGDVAKLRFTGYNLGEQEYLQISLIPKVGTIASREMNAPDMITKPKTIIFP